jgi:hypothetical protein
LLLNHNKGRVAQAARFLVMPIEVLMSLNNAIAAALAAHGVTVWDSGLGSISGNLSSHFIGDYMGGLRVELNIDVFPATEVL